MKRTFEELREEYLKADLSEGDSAADPLEQFARWFDAAVGEGLPLANACALATATKAGSPSMRMVLLKGFDARGFLFFTNHESRKGKELAANPKASLLFWWIALERQIRVEGTCVIAPAAESDDYFGQRPRESNLSAMASPQSAVIASRSALEDEVAALEKTWEGRELSRPQNWGGYFLVPERFEFWQGRESRLHDRLCYSRRDDSWVLERLAP